MPDTLTSHILAFVKVRPGRTAWGIAKELSIDSTAAKFISGSTSSMLCRLAKQGHVRRWKGPRGSWVYGPVKTRKR